MIVTKAFELENSWIIGFSNDNLGVMMAVKCIVKEQERQGNAAQHLGILHRQMNVHQVNH